MTQELKKRPKAPAADDEQHEFKQVTPPATEEVLDDLSQAIKSAKKLKPKQKRREYCCGCC